MPHGVIYYFLQYNVTKILTAANHFTDFSSAHSLYPSFLFQRVNILLFGLICLSKHANLRHNVDSHSRHCTCENVCTCIRKVPFQSYTADKDLLASIYDKNSPTTRTSKSAYTIKIITRDWRLRYIFILKKKEVIRSCWF